MEPSSPGSVNRLKQGLRDDASAINSRSKDGFTALHFACFFGQPEAARLLIEGGAAVDAVAPNPAKDMPLHTAPSAPNPGAARLLLQQGAPVNARQPAGMVPRPASAPNVA